MSRSVAPQVSHCVVDGSVLFSLLFLRPRAETGLCFLRLLPWPLPPQHCDERWHASRAEQAAGLSQFPVSLNTQHLLRRLVAGAYSDPAAMTWLPRDEARLCVDESFPHVAARRMQGTIVMLQVAQPSGLGQTRHGRLQAPTLGCTLRRPCNVQVTSERASPTQERALEGPSAAAALMRDPFPILVDASHHPRISNPNAPKTRNPRLPPGQGQEGI
jgi:hypothetical protein